MPWIRQDQELSLGIHCSDKQLDVLLELTSFKLVHQTYAKQVIVGPSNTGY